MNGLRVHRDTVRRLGVRVGQACAKIHDEKMRGRSCKQIEVDEIWGFVGMKNKMASVLDEAEGMGDVWTFIALDSENKIIPSYLVGKRVAYHANTFIGDMAERLKSRVQLSSDSLKAYADVVERGFGAEVDYGQISKTYSLTLVNNAPANVRYSPAQVVQTEKKVISGKPDVDLNSTSHIEKQNHTLRMHCRRLTRLTNTFSKKRENFEAAVALNFAYYNFCKIHTTIRCTTAMQAGIEKSQWSVAELVERCGE